MEYVLTIYLIIFWGMAAHDLISSRRKVKVLKCQDTKRI